MKKASFLLLTGIAIGAIAGLLLAPEEGTATRKKWMKKAKFYKKALKDKSEEYMDKASALKENIEGAAKDVKKRFA